MPDQGFAYNPAVAFRRLQKTTWDEDLRDIGPGGCEEVSFVERVFRRGCKPFEELPRRPLPQAFGIRGKELEEYIKTLDGWYRTPAGIYVRVNTEDLLQHIPEDRWRFLPLLPWTLLKPAEIWLGVKSKGHGPVLRTFSIFEDPNKEIVYVAIVDVEKFMSVLTTFPISLKEGVRGGTKKIRKKLRYIERKIRQGELIYQK